MNSITPDDGAIIEQLQRVANEQEELTPELAGEILTNQKLPVENVLELAEVPRKKYFKNHLQIHILNNIKNGNCEEDCGYCAQRKSAEPGSIERYTIKPTDEILEEAEQAAQSGAYRYCLVTAGRRPDRKQLNHLAGVVREIKSRYSMEVCLSAGLITNSEDAKILKDAGLDRYNHNLNTSEEYYPEICTTHTYGERVDTLKLMSAAGVELCSGVITGMGETPNDLIQAALELKRNRIASIPINFFMPIPGHNINISSRITADYALRILAMFRLFFPDKEIRMAAGREYYLKERQAEGLRVADSLFVSGYLNVRGNNARETVAMAMAAGYVPLTDNIEFNREMEQFCKENGYTVPGELRAEIELKELAELRPAKK